MGKIIFRRLSFLLLTGFYLVGGQAVAQTNIQTCLQLLEDKSPAQVASAIKAYQLLDTLHAMESAKQLALAAADAPKRVQVRAMALNARFLFYWLGPGDSLYASQMKTALGDAYALNDPFMIAEFSQWYGEMLNSLNNRPMAAQYCMNSLKMQQELGRKYFYCPKTFCLTTAEMLYRTMNYAEACSYYANAFGLPNDSISPKQYVEFKVYMAQSLNTYGRAFMYLKQYDSSLYYLQQCMQYVRQHHLPEDLFSVASDNRFDPFLELGQYDSCRKIADELYKAGMPADTMTLLSACMMRERIALRNRQLPEALKWGLQAEQYGNRTPKLLFSVYKDLSMICQELGQKEKAITYLEKWHALDDVNNKVRQKANAAFLEAESEFQKSKLRLLQLQTERGKQVRNRNILIVVLTSLAIAIIGVALYFNRKRRQSENKVKAMQEQFHFFETRHRNAEEQLEIFKKAVEEKNRLLEAAETEKPRLSRSATEIAEIEALGRQIILTTDDWEVFQQSFNALYPGFLTALKVNLPGITNAEIRMACLIRLDFDSKHIAGMLGISQESVRKAKYRLKKRFGDKVDSSLSDIIANM